jgi:hypothetical protein
MGTPRRPVRIPTGGVRPRRRTGRARASAVVLYLLTAIGFSQAGARLDSARGPGLVALAAGAVAGGAAGHALRAGRRR